jgi:hypothetical protein
MIGLAWRQLRVPAASTVTLLATLTVFLGATEHSMTSYMHSSGLAACLAAHGSCGLAISDFVTRYNILLGLFALLNVVPMLAGLFWGAPLIAREVEQGTHRLAWTQSVTRSRWLGVKVGMFVLATIVAAAILTVLFTWWSHPFARISQSGGFSFSQINPDVYDFSGTVLAAYTLYAFALGAAAGAVIRRTVPAMAATIAGFAALRVPMESVRGHLLAPLTAVFPQHGTIPGAGRGDWVLSSALIDKAGHPLAVSCGAGNGNPLGGTPCTVAGHAIGTRVVYQPLSRFWALQGIETGIVLAVVVMLLATAAWWTLRRIS